jgi:regulator of replication initiation timing
MKTHVNFPGTQVKVEINFDKKCIIKLPGGKAIEGELTEQEQEQIAYRVLKITEGVVFFDPEPIDLVGMHNTDIETLEKQAIALDELREELKDTVETNRILAKDGDELQERLTTCESELTITRQALKDTRIELSQANEKIGVEMALNDRGIVHNEPQQSDQPADVHNERDTEPPLSESVLATLIESTSEQQQEMPL